MFGGKISIFQYPRLVFTLEMHDFVRDSSLFSLPLLFTLPFLNLLMFMKCSQMDLQ